MANTVADQNCLLKLTNSTVLKKFLHQCVDELVGKEQENFYNGMDDIEWSVDEHKQARSFIQALYKKYIFEDEFSPQLSDLSSTHVEEIETCFNIRKKDIHRAVIKEQLLKSNIPLVESIDWKIKWIMGSSKLSSLSEPLVQVDLSCISNVKDGKDMLNFEMNLSQLENLITELEEIKSEF